MSAVKIPDAYVPVARTDADWSFDIAFRDEDWTGRGVSVVFARQGVPATAFEATVGDGVQTPTADMAVALRVSAEMLADKPAGRYSASVRGLDGEAIDDAAVFTLTLALGLSGLLDEPAGAKPVQGDGSVATGGVIVSRAGRVEIVRGGGAVGKSAYQQAVEGGFEGTPEEYAALPLDAAALANEKAALADEKAGLAQEATANANEKAALADEKAGLAQGAAATAEEKGDYAQTQGEAAAAVVAGAGTILAAVPITEEARDDAIQAKDAAEAASAKFVQASGKLVDPDGNVVTHYFGTAGAIVSGLYQIGDGRWALYRPILRGELDLTRLGEKAATAALDVSPRKVLYSVSMPDGTRREAVSLCRDGTFFAVPNWRMNRAAEESPTVLAGAVGNAFEVKRIGDGLRCFYSDLGPKTARYKQKVGGTLVVFDAPVMVVNLWTGQSLSIGGYTAAPVSTSAPAANNGFMLAAKGAGGMSALDFIVAKSSGVVDDEPPGYGFVAMRMARQVARGAAYRNIGVAHVGYSNTAYSGLAKGTTVYADSIGVARAFVRIARSYGMAPVFIVSNTHGESDRVNGETRAAYLGYQQQWKADYQADLRTVLGDEAFNLTWFVDQLDGSSAGAGPGVIALAQLDFVESDAAVIAVTPKYHLLNIDNLHLTARASRLLGEYHGKAADAVVAGAGWTGVRPNGSPTRVGAVITQPMFAQVAPLVFDTVTLAARNAAYGFEAAKASDGSALAISSVAIVGTNIVVTLSADPGEPVRLSYAYTAGAANAALCCAWGNLRDSDVTPAVYDGTPLHNWCWTFQKETTS